MQQELFDKLSIEDKILQAKKIISERQRLEDIKKEGKMLSTPMGQLLPEIFKEKRAIPNCFLRGALFGMVRKGKRTLVENKKIFTMSQYEIFFSGSELDQNDLELWDTLMYLAKRNNVDNELRITLYELQKVMRMPDTGANRKAIIARIKRLSFGQVSIKANKKEYFGSLLDDGLIDNDDGKLVVRYNKKLSYLFTDGDYTLLSVDIRHLIGANQLARWLYSFYESHSAKPMPFSLSFLKQLCRSESEPKEFKRMLKNALELLKKAYLSVNLNSKWDYELTDKDYLIIYPTGKTRKQQSLLKRF
jgi:Replication initiator protein A